MMPATNDLGVIERLRAAVPQEIRKMRIWLLWRKGKIPFYIDGRPRGQHNTDDDRKSLATFDEACAAFVPGRDEGLGVALLQGDALAAADLDNCVHEGIVAPEVMAQLVVPLGSYTEISPSGKGLRVLLFTHGMPSNKNIHEAGYNVEFFHGSGFVTITGNNILGDTIEWLTPEVQKRLQLWLGDKPGREMPSRDDHLTKARARDPIYQALWKRGAIIRDYPDGKSGIHCPFSDQHTSHDNASSAVYFLPHTGTFSHGYIHCLHAHCAHRTESEFMEAIGVRHIAAPTPDTLTVDADEFMAGWETPRYLVQSIIRQRFLYSLTGHSNAGKTAIGLLLATCVATGRNFGPYTARASKVVYFAGENADDVRERVIALAQHLKIEPKVLGANLKIVQARFPLAKEADMVKEALTKLQDVGLVVIDTRAAYASADDENDNVQALADAWAMRELIRATGAAILVLNHPSHGADRNSLKPRGGSAYLNELDGNLTVWNDGGSIDLHHGKIRGASFSPVTLGLVPIELAGRFLEDGTPAKTIVANVLDDRQADAMEARTVRDEDLLLRAMSMEPAGTIRTWGAACGWVNNTNKVSAILKRLDAQKLIKRVGRNWLLTKIGTKAMVDSDANFAPSKGAQK